MKCFSAIILAVFFLAAADSKVVPASESQQTGDTQSVQLSDRIKEAQEAINNFGAQLQQQFNLPNQEEIINTVNEHKTNFVNNVQSYLKTMSEEIQAKSPELESIWTNMKDKVSEAINKLSVNPETTEQLTQLRTKFQEGVQTLVTETENVAKTINENSSKVQDDIAKYARQAIDIAVQATHDLNNQLKQTTPAPQS
ncbi:hypothetical protein PUN28_007268 [Cardiocondyla obscurior]|uniref:Apolipophorin-III n=1 Tax=Cardiocondyla obscurior TaxID=286306 RepID=A0AAW2G438_9HYME